VQMRIGARPFVSLVVNKKRLLPIVTDSWIHWTNVRRSDVLDLIKKLTSISFHYRLTTVSLLSHDRVTIVSVLSHYRFTIVSLSFHYRFTIVSLSFLCRFFCHLDYVCAASSLV
jgi:hypothetical protein